MITRSVFTDYLNRDIQNTLKKSYEFATPKNLSVPSLGFTITKGLLEDDLYTSEYKRKLEMSGCDEVEKKELFIKSQPKVEFGNKELQVKWDGYFELGETYGNSITLTLTELDQLEKAIKLLRPVAKKYAARIRKEVKAKCKKQCDSI